MKNLTLLLSLLLLPAGAAAQESRRGAPTPETALRDLLANAAAWDALGPGEDLPKNLPDADDAAIAVLRQVFEQRPAAELDAFASELGRLFRDGTKFQSIKAFRALTRAGSEHGDGTRYAGAVEVFIRIYESFEDRSHPKAKDALRGIAYAEGWEYIRALYAASEKPPPCTKFPQSPSDNPCPNVSTWCDAGKLLMKYGEGSSHIRKDGDDIVVVWGYSDEGPDPDEYYSLCEYAMKGEDGRWGLVRF